nr:serine/arginine repetitive matrix protein 1-like [Caretta caretta]
MVTAPGAGPPTQQANEEPGGCQAANGRGGRRRRGAGSPAPARTAGIGRWGREWDELFWSRRRGARLAPLPRRGRSAESPPPPTLRGGGARGPTRAGAEFGESREEAPAAEAPPAPRAPRHAWALPADQTCRGRSPHRRGKEVNADPRPPPTARDPVLSPWPPPRRAGERGGAACAGGSREASGKLWKRKLAWDPGAKLPARSAAGAAPCPALPARGGSLCSAAPRGGAAGRGRAWEPRLSWGSAWPAEEAERGAGSSSGGGCPGHGGSREIAASPAPSPAAAAAPKSLLRFPASFLRSRLRPKGSSPRSRGARTRGLSRRCVRDQSRSTCRAEPGAWVRHRGHSLSQPGPKLLATGWWQS